MPEEVGFRGQSALRKEKILNKIDIEEKAFLYHHNHAAFFYQDRLHQERVLVNFLIDKLSRGYGCMIFDKKDEPYPFAQMLKEALGERLDGYLLTKRLFLLYQEYAFDGQGQFTSELLKSKIREIFTGMKSRGIKKVFWTGDPDVVSGLSGGDGKLLAFEKEVTFLLMGFPECFGICQYQMSRYSESELKDLLRAHPLILQDHGVVLNEYFDIF